MLWQWVAIITRNRSVMYSMLEKSSEDVGAQAKSLPNQIKDCLNYAESKGIVVVETLKESHSAKISGRRSIFTKMIKDLEAGKYDGVSSLASRSSSPQLTRSRHDCRYGR